MKIEHVLLTTDMSKEAQRAYGPAVELARNNGARLTLLHVVQVLSKVPSGSMLAQPVYLGDPEKERTDGERALEAHRELLGPDVDANLAVITSENVAAGVVGYAKEHGVSLIALSTHGRSGLRRMLRGSVAEDILRHAHGPVLCLPPPPATDEEQGKG